MAARIRIGARTSPLARVQADHVAALLTAAGLETEFVGITTIGDVDHRELTQIGGTGVFAHAVRDALRAGEIDLAVHSLKDLPTAPEPELDLIAVPLREDVRDVLVGCTLDDLRDGMRIGTGSPRRALQLHELTAQRGVEVEVVSIRGNVDTRLGKVRMGTVDGVLLAAAGLHRLGHVNLAETYKWLNAQPTQVAGLAAHILSVEDMLPAPGQGALALEIHQSLSEPFRSAVAALDDPVSRAECLVERGFLAALEAGCTAPVGAAARVLGMRGTSLDLTLDAVIGRTYLSNLSEPDRTGAPVRRKSAGTSTDPAEFGGAMGRRVLDELVGSPVAHHE